MDILPLLDELQIIARNGLHYAQNPYDRERLRAAAGVDGRATTAKHLICHQQRYASGSPKNLGMSHRRLGPDAAIFNAARGDLARAASRRPSMVPALRLG